MRIAAWAFVVCSLLCVIAVFVPALEFQVGKGALAAREKFSLFQLSTGKDRIKGMVATFRANKARKVGVKLLDKVSKKLGGKVRSNVNDLRDALEGVDEISDDDIATVGTVLAIATWSLLGLNVLGLALLFGDTLKGQFRRGRALFAMITTFLVASITIALYVGFTQGVAEGNDEIGRALLQVRSGTYLMPIGGTCAFLSAIVLFVALLRSPQPPAPVYPPAQRQPPQQPMLPPN